MDWLPDGVSLRMATADEIADASLQRFDYTKLTAINTCPTWGILRYSMHKAMPGGGRAMALEAGKTLHEAFAALRLAQLGYVQGYKAHMDYQGERQFGEDRWRYIRDTENPADVSITIRNMALEALNTANYVDDPFDKRRTFVNLETSLLYYIQRWDAQRYPIWLSNPDDPTTLTGVEIPFAVHVQFPDRPAFLYTGRIDGLHVNAPGDLIIGENKTASRLDDAWRLSFEMSHQVTGYCVTASLLSGMNVSRAQVTGLSIPLPRTMSDGLAIEQVRRYDYQKVRWLDWLHYTTGVHNTYVDDILNAPKFTHSCNRYFRPCSFIPFCCADEQEQRHILTELVDDEWSPLHDAKGTD